MAEVRLPRNSAALADHADSFVAALSSAEGQAASGLGAAQFTALNDALTTLRTALGGQDTAEAALRAAVETVDEAHDAAEALYRSLRQQATNHTAMTDPLREQAGLTVRDEASPGVLPAVTDLTALGRLSRSNFLDWTGPAGGGLRYEVLTRLAAGGDWALVGSAPATDFTHREAGAGVAR